MITLIYQSQVCNDLSNDDLINILTTSRHNNKLRNITGVLMYANRTFIQILEGEACDVLPLYEKIQEDNRHQDVHICVTHDISVRQFADWDMGFIGVPSFDKTKIPGYTQYADDTSKESRQFRSGYDHQFLDTVRKHIQ